MNQTRKVVTLAFSAVIALSACGSSGGSATATTVKPTATTVKPTATTVKPTATTVKPTATTVKPTATGVAIDLGKTSLGSVLVDSKGLTLYLNKKDVQGKSSTCDATCLTTWSPVESATAPTAGPGVDKAKFGTITLADGKKQVTYNGWPLYHHSSDKKAGDVTGEKVGSQWYVVDAKGAAA